MFFCWGQECEDWPEYHESNDEEKERLQDYNLLDDNYIFDGLYEYVQAVGGSSIKCAKLLLEASYLVHDEYVEYESRKCYKNRVIFNFGGGRHHGKSDKAEGFCYLNDIVLMIDYLRENDEKNVFKRIL